MMMMVVVVVVKVIVGVMRGRLFLSLSLQSAAFNHHICFIFHFLLACLFMCICVSSPLSCRGRRPVSDRLGFDDTGPHSAFPVHMTLSNYAVWTASGLLLVPKCKKFSNNITNMNVELRGFSACRHDSTSFLLYWFLYLLFFCFAQSEIWLLCSFFDHQTSVLCVLKQIKHFNLEAFGNWIYLNREIRYPALVLKLDA